jgi:hypothetical protein
MIDVINVVDDEPAPRGEVEAFAQAFMQVSSQVHAAGQDTPQPAQQQPAQQQPVQKAVGTQEPARQQQQKAREPLEEKRVSNRKLKQLLQAHRVTRAAGTSTGVLLAPTYREGLRLIMDGLVPFDQVDVDCLYGPQ